MSGPTRNRSFVAGSRQALRGALLGRGIGQSRTPRMHEAEGRRLGLSYTYETFDFDTLGYADADLPEVVRKAQRENYAGLNVTHPFKERVIPLLDGLSPEAAAIGAVNTIVFRDGMATGHNTDCYGFAESFRRGFKEAQPGEVVLVGAGGGGKAVASALLDLGMRRLAISDADRPKAKRLIETLQARGGPHRVCEATDLGAAVARADGIVNATPVGMAQYPGMVAEPAWLRPALWVADIIYFPAETELLKAARAVGCQTLHGAGMAIFQAVRAFELITGVSPDPDHMARHFRAD